MKSYSDLLEELRYIDGKGYKAYEGIRGQYKFPGFVLSIDHVQGDPFAPPSKVRAIVDQRDAKFPRELYNKSQSRIAVTDFLTRLFHENIKRYYTKVYGSGKSGVLTIDSCGQEILYRTSVTIEEEKLEARFEVGLPASGRRILGREAEAIFNGALPKIVEATLYYENIDKIALRRQVELCEDQAYIRDALKRRGLVAFVANGSILPRESGVSTRPLKNGAIPFESPESLEVELSLPNKGKIKGMGIKEGVTIIVGGGYHGKSTLLRALELGVYNHMEGDGREFVITRGDAVKIRAEDGRRVEKVDISPFITNLPNGRQTKTFSTENASGSTSQAANIMEALEVGTTLLLIDEDTSATNLMVRDRKMQRLVHKEKEPITPFIDKVRALYKCLGVSTILVVGSSGDYFSEADSVIMMDEYRAKDVTKEAMEIAGMPGYERSCEGDGTFGKAAQRIVLKSSFPKTFKGVRIRASGLDAITYDHSRIELGYLEQLVDNSQTNCIAVIIEYIMKNLVDDKLTLNNIIDRVMDIVNINGLDEISPFTGHPGNLALPRKYEIAGALNRFRYLRTEQKRGRNS